MVDIIPQSGSRVALIKISDARENMFLRRALELETVRAIAQTASPSLIEQLQTNLRYQQAAIAAKGVEAYQAYATADLGIIAYETEAEEGLVVEEGLLVEGTCDEIGRVSCWVTLDKSAPLSLTISLRLLGLDEPSKVAERLPKVLIHRNIEGEKIYEYLRALDTAWRNHSALGVFSPVQRWMAVCRDMRALGWPVSNDSKRWRLGEITVDWAAVAPRS